MSSEQQSQSQKQQEKHKPSSNNFCNNIINNNSSSSNKLSNVLEYVSDLQPIRFNGAQTLGIGTLPHVQYGLFSEKIRQNASNGFNCSIFCNGKKCKFEGPAGWKSEEMAIDGVYSCWVTDDIVMMARPSTPIIEKYKIIKQFKERGIRSVINLQQRGEHSNCGIPLEKSGFSYDPQVFMENMIFYYNFDWKDFGSVSKTTLLDMVKVVAFAVSEGKVAIHSHCGLGRTAVLVACYLVYSLRCKPNDAIAYLRTKRADLIKTKNQIQSIQAFAQFVVPMFIVFANVIPRDYRSSLNQYLKRQRFLLHGFEARLLKHIPKPVFMCCEKLLSLLDEHKFLDSSNTDLGLDEPTKDFIGDPNRFLGFYSAGYKLDLRFPSKFTTKREFAMLLEGNHGAKNHVSPKANHIMVNGLDDQKLSTPQTPASGVAENTFDTSAAFPESPASSSSPDGSSNRRVLSNRMMGGQYFKLQEEEDFLDYHLSDDEEMGENPEIEFNNNSHPNSVPLSHCRRSSRNTSAHQIDNEVSSTPLPPVIMQNGGIGIITHKVEVNFDLPTIIDADDNINTFGPLPHIVDVLEAVVSQAEPVEDDDPLADMNSEECNAIIDSVLEESPAEDDIIDSARKSKYLKRNSLPNPPSRDFETCKNGKGCPAVEEEEMESPMKSSFTNAEIADALLADHYAIDDEFARHIKKYQRAINFRASSWDRVANETDPVVLSALLWSWLDQLREPVLNLRDLSCIVIRAERPIEILQKLDMDTRYTTEYLVRFIAQLHPKSTSLKEDLLKRLLASLTHQTLGIRGIVRPVGKDDWNKMRHGTARQLTLFVQRLYDLVLHDQESI